MKHYKERSLIFVLDELIKSHNLFNLKTLNNILYPTQMLLHKTKMIDIPLKCRIFLEKKEATTRKVILCQSTLKK